MRFAGLFCITEYVLHNTPPPTLEKLSNCSRVKYLYKIIIISQLEDLCLEKLQ